VASIIVCTLDRTPRLWRGVHEVRVVQPASFFDPRLHERAHFAEATLDESQLTALLRRGHFRVRTATAADGARYVYGDRNQYFKLATLITHLGLILFLLGGAVTGLFGFETVIFVPDGGTAPVQPVGTPQNLLVKNMGFSAPRRADGTFADFATDLAVFQDGHQIARRVIHVNEPLVVDGFVFHQNTFGPAEVLQIRDASGTLVWSGPVTLEGQALGKPQGFLTIPGSQVGLFVVLDTATNGQPVLTLIGVTQAAADAATQAVFGAQLGLGGSTQAATTGGYAITWSALSAFSGMVVKQDPGQQLIWVAYLCLISGLVLTFYFPRRRVWVRLAEGRMQVAMLADRYVDAGKEFGSLLGQLSERGGVAPERGPAA
jgi:cytochrome c biogenesis protein